MKNTFKTCLIASITFISASLAPIGESIALPSGGSYICDRSVLYYVYFEGGEFKRIRVSGKCEGTGFLDL